MHNYAVNAFAQKERKYIRQGNKEFENVNFENSEVSYRKAVDLEEKKSHEPAFNVGDALYKQEKYEDAIEQFNSLADVEVSKEEKAKIYHNIGNSLLQSNKLQESIDAYKNNRNKTKIKINKIKIKISRIRIRTKTNRKRIKIRTNRINKNKIKINNSSNNLKYQRKMPNVFCKL